MQTGEKMNPAKGRDAVFECGRSFSTVDHMADHMAGCNFASMSNL